MRPEATPVEVEVEPEPETAQPPASEEAHPDEPLPARRGPMPTAGNAPSVERSPSAAPAGSAAAPPAPSGTAFTFNPSSAAPGLSGLSDQALGLAGNRFLGVRQGGGGGEAASGPEGPRNVAPGVDQSMREALDAHDHELGLDVGGPIIGVSEELTRSSDTPMNGRAVFEVVIDADGQVGEVRVLDTGGDREAWAKLGAQLGASLRARRIAWRSKGHAVAIRFEVNSRWALPSGTAAGQAVSGAFAEPSQEGMQVGGHFDLSDVGSRPSRQVHARILGEKRF